VTINGGTLILNRNVNVPAMTVGAGNLTIGSPYILQINSGTGTLFLEGANTVTINGSLSIATLTKQTTVGESTIQGSGPLTTIATVNHSIGGNLAFNKAFNITTYNMNSGTATPILGGTAALNIGTFTKTVGVAGQIGGTGVKTVGTANFGPQPPAAAAAAGTVTILANANLTVTGAVNMNGGSVTVNGTLNASSGSVTFTVSSSGTISLGAAGTLSTNTNGIYITNGSLTLSGGSSTNSFSVHIRYANASSHLILSNAHLRPLSGVGGTSAVQNLTATGASTLYGDLTANGNLIVSANGTFNLRTSLTTSLSVGGNVTLTAATASNTTSMILAAGTTLQLTNAAPLLTLNGTFDIGGGTFTYPGWNVAGSGSLTITNSAGNGIISKTTTGTYVVAAINVNSYLRIDSAVTLQLRTTTGTLTFNSGQLVMNGGNLWANNGSITVNGDSRIDNATVAGATTGTPNHISVNQANGQGINVVGTLTLVNCNVQSFIRGGGTVELYNTTLNPTNSTGGVGSTVGVLKTYRADNNGLTSWFTGTMTVTDMEVTYPGHILNIQAGSTLIVNGTSFVNGTLNLNNTVGQFTTQNIWTRYYGMGVITSADPRTLNINNFTIVNIHGTHGLMEGNNPLGRLTISTNITIDMNTGGEAKVGGHLVIANNGVVDFSKGRFIVTDAASTDLGEYDQDAGYSATGGQYPVVALRAMISGATTSNLMFNPASGIEFLSDKHVLTINNCTVQAYVNGAVKGTIELRGNAEIIFRQSSPGSLTSGLGTLMTTYGMATSGVIRGDLVVNYVVVHDDNSLLLLSGHTLNVEKMLVINGELDIEGNLITDPESKILTQTGGEGIIKYIGPGSSQYYTVKEIEVMYGGTLMIGDKVTIQLVSSAAIDTLILLNGKLEMAAGGYVEFVGPGIREIKVSDPRTLSDDSAILTSFGGLRTFNPTLLTITEDCRLTIDADIDLIFLVDGLIQLDGTLIVSHDAKVDLSDTNGQIAVNSQTAQVLRLEGSGDRVTIPVHTLTIQAMGGNANFNYLNELLVGIGVTIDLSPFNDGLVILNGIIELEGTAPSGGEVKTPNMRVDDDKIGVLKGAGTYIIDIITVGDDAELYIWTDATVETHLTESGNGTIYLGGRLILRDRLGVESKISNLNIDNGPFGEADMTVFIDGKLKGIIYLNIEICNTLHLLEDADIEVLESAKINGTLIMDQGAYLDLSSSLLYVDDNEQDSGSVYAKIMGTTNTPIPVKDILITNVNGHTDGTGLYVDTGIGLVVSGKIDLTGLSVGSDRLPAVLQLMGVMDLATMTGDITVSSAAVFTGDGYLDLPANRNVIIVSSSTFTVDSDATLAAHIRGQIPGGTDPETGSTLVLNGKLYAKLQAGTSAPSNVTNLKVQQSENGGLGGELRTMNTYLDKAVLTLYDTSAYTGSGKLYVSDLLLLNGEIEIDNGAILDVTGGTIKVDDAALTAAKLTRIGSTTVYRLHAKDLEIAANCELIIGSTSNRSLVLDLSSNAKIDGTLSLYGEVVADTITTTSTAVGGKIVSEVSGTVNVGKVLANAMTIPVSSIFTVEGFSGTDFTVTNDVTIDGTLLLEGRIYSAGNLVTASGSNAVLDSVNGERGTLSVVGLDITSGATMTVREYMTLDIRVAASLAGAMNVEGELHIPAQTVGSPSLTTGSNSLTLKSGSVFKIGNTYFIGGAACHTSEDPPGHFNELTGDLIIGISTDGILTGSLIGTLQLWDNPLYTCNFSDDSIISETGAGSRIWYGAMNQTTLAPGMTSVTRNNGSYLDRTALGNDGLHVQYTYAGTPGPI